MSRNQTIEVTPLGGVGEFGTNCMLLADGSTRVMIDCGIRFPEPHHYGVDLIVPGFEALREQAANNEGLDALLLTHGHEDHIGAVPFLIKAWRRMGASRNIPIYGTPFTMELVQRKLEEHDIVDRADLHTIRIGDRVDVDGLTVEWIGVNHSIPDAAALAVETSRGIVLHTGDWRIDHTPVGEPEIDLHRFSKLGKQGVVLMLGDSTNSGRPGYTNSERTVGDELTDVFDVAPGRVIVTQFSSNVCSPAAGSPSSDARCDRMQPRPESSGTFSSRTST